MASSLWTQVARASAAGLRPRAAVLVPTMCRSLYRMSIPRNKSFWQLKRGYAAEATARAEVQRQQAPVADADSDISEDKPLFASLKGKIHPKTLKALVDKPFNYNHMSVVQAAVLPLLPGLAQPRLDNPESKDLLVKARTGTGKTIAFLVPAIEARVKQLEAVGNAAVQKRYAQDNIGALIISPTRELASQIVVEAQKLTTHFGDWQVPMFVGGLDRGSQINRFRNGRKDIVVATAGRLRDMLQDPRSGVVNALKNTKMLILDEADTLLDMGFRDDIEDIMRYLPDSSSRQTLLFSATVSESIKQIADAHMSENHAFINCVTEDASPVHAHIPQYNTIVPNPKDQIPHVLRLIFQDQIEHGEKSKIVLFLSTTKMTQLVSSVLTMMSSILPQRTFMYELHSKKTMNSRVRASDGFRKTTRPSVLITSDVSARGVDYPGVTRVIQLGLPKNPEQYVHRVGRTGRGGSLVGRGDLVVGAWEQEFVRRSLSHIPLKPVTVQDFKEECEAQVATRPDALVKLQDLDRASLEVCSRLQEDVVGETMVSQLGFYAGMTSLLRLQTQQILEELKKWAVQGMGLSRAPYVSPSMLARLGVSSGHSRRDRGGLRGNDNFNKFGTRDSPARQFGERREWRDDRKPFNSDRPASPWRGNGGSSPQRSWPGRYQDGESRRDGGSSWKKPSYRSRERSSDSFDF